MFIIAHFKIIFKFIPQHPAPVSSFHFVAFRMRHSHTSGIGIMAMKKVVLVEYNNSPEGTIAAIRRCREMSYWSYHLYLYVHALGLISSALLYFDTLFKGIRWDWVTQALR